LRWLITVHADFDLDALVEALAAADAALGSEDPVPLGEDELALFAEGPANLSARLAETTRDVIRINPDSKPEPYGDDERG